jgi:hypothetical protein
VSLEIYDLSSTSPTSPRWTLPNSFSTYNKVFPQEFVENVPFFEKGKVYKIEVKLRNNGGGYFEAKLKWRTPEMACIGFDYDFIPTKFVYTTLALATASIISNPSITTYKLDGSKATGNLLNDRFALLQGKKMILSAWVKETSASQPNEDCKCVGYIDNKVSISFSPASSSQNLSDLHATGNIIEGWQRYQVEFEVPENATDMTVSLQNTGNKNVYFDDIRIHPFNANEKSFVYHSSSLRLMAELDENNYASFYEYDDDGTLTRVKKETVRGVKTIKETRSAIQVSQ